MSGPFRDGPATAMQIERIRELARWPGMPPEMVTFVEERIARGLDVNRAYNLIGKLGERACQLTSATDAAVHRPAAPLRNRAASDPQPTLL